MQLNAFSRNDPSENFTFLYTRLKWKVDAFLFLLLKLYKRAWNLIRELDIIDHNLTLYSMIWTVFKFTLLSTGSVKEVQHKLEKPAKPFLVKRILNKFGSKKFAEKNESLKLPWKTRNHQPQRAKTIILLIKWLWWLSTSPFVFFFNFWHFEQRLKAFKDKDSKCHVNKRGRK